MTTAPHCLHHSYLPPGAEARAPDLLSVVGLSCPLASCPQWLSWVHVVPSNPVLSSSFILLSFPCSMRALFICLHPSEFAFYFCFLYIHSPGTLPKVPSAFFPLMQSCFPRSIFHPYPNPTRHFSSRFCQWQIAQIHVSSELLKNIYCVLQELW